MSETYENSWQTKTKNKLISTKSKCSYLANLYSYLPYKYISYRPLTLFIFFWQENEFNICIRVLFPYNLVINQTPAYIWNSFSCQKNVNRARVLTIDF